MSLIRAKEKLAAIEIMAGNIKRHLEAGTVDKANFRAADLEDLSKDLFNLTYNLAFPEDKSKRVNCLRCQPGGFLDASCTCGRVK